MVTRLFYRKEFHPLGPQFHFLHNPSVAQSNLDNQKLNFMILFRLSVFGLASQRADSLGLC